MAIPSRSTSRSYLIATYRSLAGKTAHAHFRLSEIIEHCAQATAHTEDKDVLSAAAYLQECGIVHGSRSKASYSKEMIERDFGEHLDPSDTPDAALLDCILHHGSSSTPAATPEGRLMKIIYTYAITHYLDFISLKSRVSNTSFEALQHQRISTYTQLFKTHPRGPQIEKTLQDIFLLRQAPSETKWHKELTKLHRIYPHSLKRLAQKSIAS